MKTNSTILETVVANATPAIPIFGAPNKPKIKTEFKKMLTKKAVTVIVDTIFTLSILFNPA